MKEDIRETIKNKLLESIRDNETKSKTTRMENRHLAIVNFKSFIEALKIEPTIPTLREY